MQTAIKPFEVRKRRDFGAVVGDTFVYMRKHLKPIVKSVVIIAGPFLLLASIYRSIAQANIFEINPDGGLLEATAINSVVSSVFMLLAMVLLTATIHAYVKIDIERNSSEEIRTDEVWQEVKQNIWKSLGIILLFFLIFFVMITVMVLIMFLFFKSAFGATNLSVPSNGLGTVLIAGLTMILFMITILYLLMRFSFVYVAGLLDEYSSTESFTRSWSLTDGYFWNNVGIMFIFGMLVGMISGIASIPTVIFTVVGAMHGTNADINPICKFVVITIQTVGTFIALIGYVLPFIAYILQYYSAVEKTEGVGLLQRIENMNLKTEDNQHWGEETY